ncbi:ABC transporter permease [Flexithrix dorotheae]|uniref:ABC transporter permease n=1 Tax=Flexithrix dorotheae TaxID=70993 RepID=UPI0003707987|nr:ABC transporter permease [Flexithrix dorotheae]
MKNSHPPRIANKLLLWFLKSDLVEEVLGDLEEQYFENLEKYTNRKANWLYWYQVLNYLRPFAIKNIVPVSKISNGMFKSYLKLSWRNLIKQKLYSSINIGGLAIGLASFIMIFFYVEHELSYDNFYPNEQQIYRITQRQPGNVYKGSDYFAVTPTPLASTLEREFPEVIKGTTINYLTALISNEDDNYWEEGLWADQNYFEVFNYPLLSGDPQKVLEKPYSIVLTASFAKKIFGNLNPLGKELKLKFHQDENQYKITGLIPDLPENSSIKFNYIVSFESNNHYSEALKENSWNNNSYFTFFLLKEGANPAQLEQKIKQAGIPQKYQTDKTYPFKDEYYVNSLADLHLNMSPLFDIGLKGNKKYVYFFSVIAILILVLACINYMNLAVARSINRAREVGLRKAIGAFRQQLIVQFLGESILITLIAFVIALGMVQLVIPYFGYLIERPLKLDLFSNNLMLPGILFLLFFVGTFSGSYPAFYLSGLHPIKVLKGKIDNKSRNSNLQQSLVIGQYAVSIILIIACIVIYKQLQFIQKKELGYNKEHIITITVRDMGVVNNIQTLKNKWLSYPNIKSVTYSNNLPTNISSSTIINDDDDIPENDLSIYETRVDYDYLDVYGIELIAGRNFSREHKSDIEEGYLINETAALALGWTPEQAIGKQFTHNGVETVLGVVKDFHMHSMHLSIEPLMIHLTKGWVGNIAVKVHPENLPETISYMERNVNEYTKYPFEYSFLDEKFNQLYKAEEVLGETFGFFTILAIVIASMGLFGLAAISVEHRGKEIGIRKVLGASAISIVSLIAKNFIRMVAVAFILAIPLAWYLMDKWLQDFAFRIEMEWWIFILSGCIVFLIAYLTIGYQTIKAALLNPINRLRNE